MASTKNSQNNIFRYNTFDQLKFVQMNYFSTASNNAQSCKQKLDIIYLICFLTQKMNEKDSERFPSAISVLEMIFKKDLSSDFESPGMDTVMRSFGMICDDLLWGTVTPLEKPEGYSNASEIKDKIVSYFNEEYTPF